MPGLFFLLCALVFFILMTTEWFPALIAFLFELAWSLIKVIFFATAFGYLVVAVVQGIRAAWEFGH